MAEVRRENEGGSWVLSWEQESMFSLLPTLLQDNAEEAGEMSNK